MDDGEEAREYNRMDHGEVNRRFVADLLATGDVGRQVLDLGAGTALIPIELCRCAARCRVWAVDVSAAMLELARLRVAEARLAGRIVLVRADAKQLPFRAASFDTVISNSIVHHVPEPLAVMTEAWRVVRPGGIVFFRDLLRPPTREELERLVATYAGGESRRARELFAASLGAALTVEEVRERVAALGADPNGVRQTSDRHFTWAARRSL
ncbi:MAG: class I SAM-dependent methyltransferase [Candidatus Dadabacteria bacterium]|nr:MAG: class I SAM-dependent methyltransferase [Candidatus Dadabacteria bacterium]